MTGDTDYLMRVVAADVDAYQRLLRAKIGHFPGVRAIRSSFALRRVIHKTALPLGQLDI
jgi:DNA-binding Lrp family transcriptional regulator